MAKTEYQNIPMCSQYSDDLIQWYVKYVETSDSEPKFRTEDEWRSHVSVSYSPSHFALFF